MQNKKATTIAKSPKTYEAMRIERERGHLWDLAIARIGEGNGRDAREVIHEAARKMGLKL